MPKSNRSFLFLQGVCSPFFARLADRLLAEGHRIAKVNFNCGDVAYWWNRPASAFRGRLEELASFLGEKYQAEGITDIVLFGDRRPVHRPAIETARRMRVRIHVFEEGYFRPYWVTLERDGVNSPTLRCRIYVPIFKMLDIRDVDEGRYRLAVEVTDNKKSRTVRASRVIDIAE